MEQSQKRGLKSDAQKQERAREGYDPIPAANSVAGAFGEHKRDTPTDKDLALDKANTKDQANTKSDKQH